MFGGIGTAELVVMAIIAVILFGSKLPEVARNVGNSYAQFRRGLSDIQSSIDLEATANESPSEYEQSYDDVLEPAGPKFVPPADEDE